MGDTTTLTLGAPTPTAPLEAALVRLAAEPPDSGPPAIVLGRGGVVVGREPPPGGLRIAQTAVSRLHARVELEGAELVVRDLESRNGTFVDGRRVTRAAVSDGAVVRFGNALYTVALERGAARVAAAARAAPRGFEGMVGGGEVRLASEELSAVAHTDLAVLLLGETGTGKEVAARAVHAASGRRGAFVAVNCAAIPAGLFESELFGHRRGAFTGADQDRPGHVRAASGGTLLLDEIGELPLEAQAKLLRVLEAREVVPLGSSTPVPVDVRLVCATHRDLRARVDEGTFRADLYARLAQHTTRLPPLRARKADLPGLVRTFLARAGAGALAVDFAFWVHAAQYAWPFNVRELEAAVRRAAALSTGGPLTGEALPEAVRAAMEGYGEPADAEVRSVTAAPREGAPSGDELRALLAAHAGNVTAVARALGKDRTQINRWLKRHGLDADAFRGD